MGINIGLDIGPSVSNWPLWASGRPADPRRPVCHPPAVPHDGTGSAAARPFRVPAHRWQPHSIHLRSVAGVLRNCSETQVEGIRVTGSGSRTIAKVLALFFENEFKAIARMMVAVYRRCAPCSKSAARARSTSGSMAQHRGTMTARGSARPVPGRSSISRRCACSTRWRRSARSSVRLGARRGSPGAARCSPRAT